LKDNLSTASLNVSNKKMKIQETKSDKLFNFINITICVILLSIYLYPLYFVVIASISEPNAIWNGEVVFWPKDISWEGYIRILNYKDIWMGYWNSIKYTAVGTLVNVVLTMITGYVLSRKEFMIRGILMKLFVFTMFFSGGLIPSYILIRDLGLLDSFWVVIIPGAISIMNVIIVRTFIQTTIPEELKEAAFIEGCGHFNYFLRVVLPLSTAIIGVMALYYGVGHWNSYFNAMIYLSTREKFPLQIVLREILVRFQDTELLEPSGDDKLIALQMRLAEVIKYCAILVTSIPAMIAYPFVQKAFVKGVMIGSIKG
jgi:putative aldouronate transport system permease protein